MNHRNRKEKHLYAVAATTGATGGASVTGADSSTAATGAGAVSFVSAVVSRGATGAGCSICGGLSSGLAGAGAVSFLGLGLKRSLTRAERRRATFSFDGLAARCYRENTTGKIMSQKQVSHDLELVICSDVPSRRASPPQLRTQQRGPRCLRQEPESPGWRR